MGIFKNDGGGALAIDRAAVPEIIAQIHGLPYAKPVPADFDGDGDVDLLIPMYVDAANTTDVPNLLLLNDGTGKFTLDDTGRLPEIVDHGNYCSAAAAGDIDADGDQDIFLGVLYLQSRLLINDGTGHFLEQSGRLPSNALQPIGAEMADVDVDGDLDIVTSNRELDGVVLGTRIYENDGTGRFTLHALPEELEHQTADFALGDLNDDGILDFAVTNYLAPEDGNGIQILLGRGEGAFERAAAEPAVGGARGISFADLDGDGRLDIVVSIIDEVSPNVLLFGKERP